MGDNKIKFALLAMSLLAMTITISSCKDMLDINPRSSNSVKGFYKTEKDFNQAVIGLYDGLQQANVTNIFPLVMLANRSDDSFQTEITSINDNLATTQFNISPSNPILNDAWGSLYEVINRANTIIEKIGNTELEQAKKDQYIGEAKFGRALCYFDLVRYFGGVPIVTNTLSSSEALDKERSSREEVYQLIIQDLEEAINKLPESYTSDNIGRATSYAAEGILGRIYMTRSGYPLQKDEWEKAKSLFQDIMQSGKFIFYSNYRDIFNISNDNGKQFIFSIQFKSGNQGEGNPIPTRYAPNLIDKNAPLGLPFGGSPNWVRVSQDLIDSFESGDVRLNQTIRLKWRHNDGTLRTNQPWVQKFVSGAPTNPGDWDINWPVLRYTDVLMMYAEALNETGYEPSGTAFDIVNRVRTRAGLEPKTSADVPDQQAFRNWIIKERRHEFAFENLRWHTLVRTDRALKVMRNFLSQFGFASNVKSKDQYIYPIPLRVIQTNPSITQNPGY